MTLVTGTVRVRVVGELVKPGDLETGDVIALPDDHAGRFRVMTVRLGHGGFIVAVTPANGAAPGTEREVTLTVAAQLRRYGRIRAF
jgi:pSer/pThr/pTyr-binding forkhead associated (FHA) protein